jgi:3-hydroxy-9,10-secoandrosta-1,3,5(10)-triene-9,17-dione monooxygenase
MTVTSIQKLSDTPIDRARALVPMLRQHGQEIARAARLPDSVMQEIRDAGLMQLARPRYYGGPEVGMDVILRIATELAKGDGSAGWVYAVTNSHDHLVGLYPKEVQDEYWASAEPLCASSYLPTGKAKKVNGGYILSGKWPFCSGIDFCGWIAIGGFIEMTEGGNTIQDLRFFMIEKSQIRVIDDWQVMGLSGTGSKSILCEDLFVPEIRALRNADIANGATPGADLHDNPMYRTSIWPLFGFSILAPATGIARGAYEVLVEDFRQRAVSDPNFESRRVATQMHLAEVSALIEASELLYARDLEETFALVSARIPLSDQIRVRNRRDEAFLAGLCRKALDIMMSMSGGRGLREEGVVQRGFRDIIAVSNHPGGNWDSASASFGSVLFGGRPTELTS